MSNTRIKWMWPLALSAALILAAGCASEIIPLPPDPAPPPSPAVPPPAEDEAPPLTLPPGAARPPAPFAGRGWQGMSDGRTLAGWRETPFTGRGEIQSQPGAIILHMGNPFTGINWTNDFPQRNYEIALDAMRVTGSDFFCGLTVPVGTNCCSLIVGGWGGSLVGLSCVDGLDAAENETTKFRNFESGRWYRIRLRVTEQRITAWIDEEKLVDLATAGRKFSVRPGDIELSQPLGLAAWQTTTALREIKFRRLDAAADKED